MTKANLAVALVASVATAQFELYTINQGNDQDEDGFISQTTCECTGSFDSDPTAQFFFGITGTEGSTEDHMVGWGKNLCDGTAVSSNYTIQFAINEDYANLIETSQIFMCDPSYTRDMAEHLWDQINDNAIAKSLIGLNDAINDGSLVWIDPTLSAHSQAVTDSKQLVDEQKAAQDDYIENDVKAVVFAKIEAIFSGMATDYEVTFDSIVDAAAAAIEELVLNKVDQCLSPEEIVTWNDSGLAQVTTVLTDFQDEFDDMKANYHADLEAIETAGKKDVQAICDTLIGNFAQEQLDLYDVIDAAGTMDQWTWDRMVLPKMKKSQSKNDKQLN